MWRTVEDSENTLSQLQKPKRHLLSASCVPFSLLFIFALSLFLTETLGGRGGSPIFPNEAAEILRVFVTCLRSQSWEVEDPETKPGSNSLSGMSTDSAFCL